MTELKCPFCGEKLQQTFSFNPKQFWCSNYYNHKHPINLQGTKELWQELIRTRKALDVAVDALKRLEKELYFNNAKQTGHIADSVMSIPSIALEQITALEQKEVK